MEIIKHEGRFYKIRVDDLELMYENTLNNIYKLIGEFEFMEWYKDEMTMSVFHIVRITRRNILFRKFDSDINRKKEILFRRF